MSKIKQKNIDPSNGINKLEKKILKFWKDRDIFESSLKARRGRKRYVFWEGPPTANGQPHIGHLLTRIFKDFMVRYKTMQGYYVLRKAGWDTQGIPVELEVEKKLGFKNKKDIENYGVAKFNKKARESVWKYKEEWERFSERVGFWLDFKNPYITYETPYIESLWSIIREFDKKGLLYKGHKVLPWCPRCGTVLSGHEVAQGYKDVTEPSIYIKFRLLPGQKIRGREIPPDTYLTAWTTTPWTLPGNVALAVGKDIEYQIIKAGEENLIIARDLAGTIGIKGAKATKALYKGKDLAGLEYEPLFDVPALRTKTAYKVYLADFVSTQEGTGIVHTAVMYGDDDYMLGVRAKLPQHHTVDESGRFTKDVRMLSGKYVKAPETEKSIISHLVKKGLLIKTKNHTHSYPFCWRCDTQLLYYAKDSWFVAMSTLRKQLLENNAKVNWRPEYLRDGRFGEFLREVRDWAFSRERYWGTPLPVWVCADCSAKRVIGSFAELDKYRFSKGNTYYLLRHGHSTKNTGRGVGIISSKLSKDKYELTKQGVADAKKVAALLKKEGGLDMIFASPFVRTKQTARIIAAELDMSIEVDDRIRELDHGSACEGKDHYACLPPGTKPIFSTKYGDGESWRDMTGRMIGFIKDMELKYEGKKILIVSHGDPLWGLAGTLQGKSEQEMIDTRKTEYLEPGEFKKLKAPNYPYSEEGRIDPHRPYVDEVYLKCPKCKGKMERVREVADVWFDSGAMPYAQWHYPFENRKLFNENFPADYISEAVDQTRGWFYTLLAISTALGKGTAYKNVISLGHVLDKHGKKMSKSIGNVISPWDALNKYGADATRWFFYTVNSPGDPKPLALEDIGNPLKGFLMTLMNSLRFYELYGGRMKHSRVSPKPKTALDRWILSRLANLISSVTKELDDYKPMQAARMIEAFAINDLSNWWIRRSRSRFQKPTDEHALREAALFLRHLLIEVSKLTAPFVPFISDFMYKQLTNAKESVHLENWPKASKRHIDRKLELDMGEVREVVAFGLAKRKEENIKVRQPLASVTVYKKFNNELEEYIKEELNVKQVFCDPSQKEPALIDVKLSRELLYEGYARDLTRYIQGMRKEARYGLKQKVYAYWSSGDRDIKQAIQMFLGGILNDTLLLSFGEGIKKGAKYDVKKAFPLGHGKITIAIKAHANNTP